MPERQRRIPFLRVVVLRYGGKIPFRKRLGPPGTVRERARAGYLDPFTTHEKSPCFRHYDRNTGALPGKDALHANKFQAVYRRTINENAPCLLTVFRLRAMGEGMENYFDIATEQEIAARFPVTSTNPEWLAHCRASTEKYPDRNCALLAGLWFSRGDRKKADYYLDQIKDERERLDMSITLYELRKA